MDEKLMKEEIGILRDKGPRPVTDEYRYDNFDDGRVVCGKKKGRLPVMGWNSWNAFGSGNTEALTKEIADSLLRLGLDKLGYRYVVLDDGCYFPERVDGKLTNDKEKFPSGFKALADHLHSMGLKFGMYNDIGSNLCAGAYVGTCGHEATDAETYLGWDIDFLKVDNCYYLWDNATFGNPWSVKYVFAPNIKGIRVSGKGTDRSYSALEEGRIEGASIVKSSLCVGSIGTEDGAGPGTTPIGVKSGELIFDIDVEEAGEYELEIEYAADTLEGQGSWLQVATDKIFFDGFVPKTPSGVIFGKFGGIKIELGKGRNRLRLMNHRRQENTLRSYATLLEEFMKIDPDKDLVLSICEWGKTQPQNWAYKVGDSWRILNDITFRVGSDGKPCHGEWEDDYTTSICSQYDKAVIMDEFAGLDKGWNDTDMMIIGAEGLDLTQNRTHMAMWCMMNSPLILGLDLRKVVEGDDIHKIIANKDLVALNQDPLGVQAKRIYCSIPGDYEPDTAYIRDNERADIIAKPLADGSVALSFINLSSKTPKTGLKTDVKTILGKIGDKLPGRDAFENAKSFKVKDLWSGEVTDNTVGVFEAGEVAPCDNVTVRITPDA